MAFDKSKHAGAPETDVSLISNHNFKHEARSDHEMSTGDIFSIEQDIHPSVMGIGPEMGCGNIIEQEIHALNGIANQDDIKIEDTGDFDIDLDTAGSPESCPMLKRENAPSPDEGNKVASVARTSIKVEPAFSTAKAHSCGKTTTAQNEIYNIRVLLSPTPETASPPVQCRLVQSTLSPSRALPPTSIAPKINSRPTMDVGINIQSSSTLQNSKPDKYFATNAQTQTDAQAAPEPAARSHASEKMSLHEADLLFSAPSTWLSPPPPPTAKVTGIMDSYFREHTLRQAQRQHRANYRVNKTAPKASPTTNVTGSHSCSAAQQQHTILCIKDKGTGNPRIILTAPKGMLPRFDLQGQTMKISLIKA